MVNIKPFSGLRYNQDKVGSYDDVTAPPYDVISPQEQVALHEKSPYNIVRLILGMKQAADTDTENVYSRAHETVEAWREQGVLQAESAPAIYAYTQSWDGMERRGFIAALRTESYETGQVLPHEYTLGGPKADRLALFKATGTILSPIFCLYHDAEKQAEALLFANLPANHIAVTDKDGVLHKFWPVTDAAVISKVQNLLSDKSALIADGHHRYETAVAYRDWRREQDAATEPHGDLPWDYTMAFFTNTADEGLKIYPTHRIFDSFPEGWTEDKLLEAMAQYFEPTTEENALFWIESGKVKKTPYALKAGVDISAIPEPLRPLDVAILDQLVFQGLLKQPANELKQAGHLHFVRDDQEVADYLANKALIFHVHAPSVEMTREICESGYRMPQKSTYFYPKLLSGLVEYYYGPTTSQRPADTPQGAGAAFSS